MNRQFITSESVTEGHPDKIADQVSDAILDCLIAQDPMSRVAIETMTTTGLVICAGEVTTRGFADVQKIARDTLRRIGYIDPQFGIDCEDTGVLVSIHGQSPDIALGVDEKSGKEQGAGDQGMMYGYACNETPELMPLPIILAHKLTARMAEVRKKGIIRDIGPDGKSQVTIEYENGKPLKISSIVIAQQHKSAISEEELRKEVMEKVIMHVCGKMIDEKTKVYINATGSFIVGGPEGDTGVTGRKIIADSYGGVAKHGGGCFCVNGDALVNTEKGLLKISEMKSCQNMLIKTDFSPTKVEQWFYNGEKETIKLKTKDGYTIEGTPNQCVRIINESGKYDWRRLDQLKNSDWLAIQKKNRLFGQSSDVSDFKFSHKPSTYRKNIFTFPKELTEDYAYLLGLLIGDGNCMMEGGIAICVCEEEQKKNVQSLYKRLFGREGKIFSHWAFFGGVELRAYLKYLGLERFRSWEKTVPKSILKAPKTVIAAFLRGLFDTDGTIRLSGRRRKSLDIKLSSTSLDLIQKVQLLLLNFGVISAIQTVNTINKEASIRGRKIISRHILYNLRLKGSESFQIFKQEIGFGLPRKANILNSIKLNESERLIIPNQRERIIKLWKKISSREHQLDKSKIGRFTRSKNGKATKELTYSKLCKFLDAYEPYLQGNYDFEYLRTLYILKHYYTQVESIEKSMASVFDITVPGAHTFTANGFVCHNSGKDPSKVDRSASYMARYIAKNIVASGLADKCEVMLSYVIGVAEPTSINVECFGTNKIPEEKISELVRKHFKLTPKGIIDSLNLRRPIYSKTSVYGHFGRNDSDFTWEKTDKAEVLREEAGMK